MNFRTVAAVVVGISLLSGCSAVDAVRDVVAPSETPLVVVSEDPHITAAPDDVVEVQPPASLAPSDLPSPVVVRGLDGEPKPRASAEAIAPDAELMASMTCEPVSEETLERLYRLHGERWQEAVQVEVGEGLTEGETWWVIAGRTDTYPGGGAIVTSFPGGGNGWHYLGDSVGGELEGWNPWDDVQWDAERLIRGQSALAKALGCLPSKTP